MSDTRYFMASAKVGPKGQIVIPKEIRDMFGIASGDSLMVMADKEKGIAIKKQDEMEAFAKMIFSENNNAEDSGARTFASAIDETVKNGEAKL